MYHTIGSNGGFSMVSSKPCFRLSIKKLTYCLLGVVLEFIRNSVGIDWCGRYRSDGESDCLGGRGVLLLSFKALWVIHFVCWGEAGRNTHSCMDMTFSSTGSYYSMVSVSPDMCWEKKLLSLLRNWGHMLALWSKVLHTEQQLALLPAVMLACSSLSNSSLST